MRDKTAKPDNFAEHSDLEGAILVNKGGRDPSLILGESVDTQKARPRFHHKLSVDVQRRQIFRGCHIGSEFLNGAFRRVEIDATISHRACRSSQPVDGH